MPTAFAEEYQPLLIKGLKDTTRPMLTWIVTFPNKSLLIAGCAACIGGTFQYGYNVSIINAPTMYVQDFLNQTWRERFQTDISRGVLTLLWSTIVSMFTLGGLIGASVGGAMSVMLGRKGTLLINNIFALTAALLLGLSYPTGVFALLIIGRLFTGINAGISLCVQPLYLGEIAPTALRGAIGMGTSVFITGGILTGQVVGLKELLGREEYWPILLSTTCIPAFLQLLILPWFPESPRYLYIDKGDDEGCKKAFAAQQLNGINAIYFYADYLFKQSGISQDKIPYVTIGTGACECITALTCSLLIERLGRKVLITGGYTLMGICCILFMLTLSFQDASPILPYLSMACVFAFILSFGLGPGGVTNILTTELFTQTTRPAAYMIAGSVNWLSFLFIGLTFPFIVIGLQQYCFLVFLIICFLVATYILLIVPETKNRSFLEIQNEFQTSTSRADGAVTTLLSTSI